MLVTKAEEMRNLDRETIEVLGIPGIVLMENAARGVTSVIYDKLDGNSVVVICGKGNNGGDGLAIARNLYNLGYDVEVVLTAKIEELKGDARINAEVLSKLPVPLHVVKEESKLLELYSLLKEADFIVDAIFGTGLSKPAEGFYKDLIEVINKANKPIISVDIPSGLSSDTGEIIGAHIIADITVTFGFPKLAHIMPPACYYVGELFVVDISIPEDVFSLVASKRYILTLDEVAFTFPVREIMSHKYTYGHVAVIGGSAGKTGAPSMTAQSALRTGAGLSTVVVPASLNTVFEIKLTEAMSIPIPDAEKGYFGIDTIDEVVETIEKGKFSSVVIGPGLGNEPETFEFAREFIRKTTKPLVIDADGINALAENTDILKMKEQNIIITPHIGEFSRLTGLSKEEILKEPYEIAKEFAEEFGVTVILKSGRTVIATPSGKVYINIIGNPGMATAGTGDVLAGILGALLGMGIEMEDAAKFGVFLHSLAGDIAAEELSQESLKACDIIDFLPKAIKRIKEKEINLEKHKLPFVTNLREIIGV
ncbi:NAD(P)H-hydrate dehydratase [Desulfurobacterium thermolithotrophum]|uniref:NAD(P)H-hydrate dehydratase n=1 Tax=Desulfurobacterium thermolithotrophum TaxID=64160 RepID=UPI0013D8C7A1|nr:NAD(P)H-hydrate dehydratase [Desulfurobacterium thermolithotrophum]